MIDLDTLVLELQLQYNMLETLEGALMGFHGLLKLNLSHNLIKVISPEDLIGLDNLEVLDISHNFITSLEETSRVRNINMKVHINSKKCFNKRYCVTSDISTSFAEVIRVL